MLTARLRTSLDSLRLWLRYAPGDALDSLLGRRVALVPPRRLAYVGPGDFAYLGQEFRRYFVELGGLQPGDRVLDIGCGVGRMAIPLIDYLEPPARFDGFDVSRRMIHWCQEHITPEHPNFVFEWTDVYNRQYNPGGSIDPGAFRFPVDDGSKDFVFATSVFTHMRAPGVEHYMAEIARTLAPGGTCLVTFFILDEVSRAHRQSDASAHHFVHEQDGYYSAHQVRHEIAVAFDEAEVKAMLVRHGLMLKSIEPGGWSGRRGALSAQDLVIAQRG